MVRRDAEKDYDLTFPSFLQPPQRRKADEQENYFNCDRPEPAHEGINDGDVRFNDSFERDVPYSLSYADAAGAKERENTGNIAKGSDANEHGEVGACHRSKRLKEE